MILMKVHARTGRVAVAGLEKMLAKVPWLLGEVSLYHSYAEGGRGGVKPYSTVWGDRNRSPEGK